MKALHGLVLCSLAFAALSGSQAHSTPSPKTSCEALPAAQAAKIIGKAVTERLNKTPSVPAGVCMYSSGRPILMLSVRTFPSAQGAARVLQAEGHSPNTAERQKGAFIVSVITMDGDTSKFDALLDAALQNL